MQTSGDLDLEFEFLVENYTFHIELDRSKLTEADLGDHIVKLKLTDDVSAMKNVVEFKIVI